MLVLTIRSQSLIVFVNEWIHLSVRLRSACVCVCVCVCVFV